MKLPKYIKTPAQISQALAEHDARVNAPGYQVTMQDNLELLQMLQAQAKYLAWVAQNGAPDAL